MTLLTDPPTPAQDTPPAKALTTPPTDSGWFRAFLLRIHFYAGILAGPFLLIAAITGGLYALTPQLEQALYSRELHVPAVSQPLPLSSQVQAAVGHAGGAPVSVRPAPGPEETTRVLFADPALGESQYRTLFVDPGTSEIRGDLPTYGSSGALPLRTWISNLHRSLNLGEPGRIYSELAASWLWVIALGGLLLWLDRIRRRRTSGKKAAGTKPSRASGRARVVWLHGTTGTALLAGFLFLSATGLTWSASAGDNIAALRTALGWATPTVSTSLAGPATAPASDHGGHAGAASAPAASTADPADYDTVSRIARADIIAAPMIDIKPPATEGKAWTVTEAGREWPATASAVAIDPSTETITSRADFDDFSPAAKLTRWTIAAHMGLLFGLPNQLVLLGVAAGLAAMVVWGYGMWWKRRPTRGSAWAFGRPAPRGAFLRAHWAGVLAAITVMVALGLFLPLLGWSLLAFVILDTAVGAAKGRRRRAADPTPAEQGTTPRTSPLR